MRALFYDTETTGLPQWHEPSDGENQPHIVQLAARLVDLDTREPVCSMNRLVCPNGWEIPDEVIAVHGITNERATEEGLPESAVVSEFFELWEAGGDDAIRVGHNESFDRRLIRIATKRYPELNKHIDPWHDLPKERSFCTMWKSINICQIPMTEKQKRARIRGKYKQPTLAEAYQHFFDKEIEGAHDAMVDVDACIAVYFKLRDVRED